MSMALYIIGIGLNDEKDITLKGIETIKKCKYVYLDNYTSKINCKIEELEKLYNKEITLADRNLVENKNNITENAKKADAAFLVAGDALSATTHIDLMLRAKKQGIKTHIIHNASILTAIGITGLQLYKFGKTASIPFNNETVDAPYDMLKENQKINAHTLFLLDLEPDKNKFMTVQDAIRYLLRIELKRNEKIFSEKTLCIGCARLGSEYQVIKKGTAKELLGYNLIELPQCLIVPAKMHFMEEEALSGF